MNRAHFVGEPLNRINCVMPRQAVWRHAWKQREQRFDDGFRDDDERGGSAHAIRGEPRRMAGSTATGEDMAMNDSRKDDLMYLLRRAAQESRRSRQAENPIARHLHSRLAEAYRSRAAQERQGGTVPGGER